MFAGRESTVVAIGMGALCLLTSPAQWHALTENPGLERLPPRPVGCPLKQRMPLGCGHCGGVDIQLVQHAVGVVPGAVGIV